MVLGVRPQSCYLSVKYILNLSSRPVSGLGLDVYECLIHAVPVGTANTTAFTTNRKDVLLFSKFVLESKDLCQ